MLEPSPQLPTCPASPYTALSPSSSICETEVVVIFTLQVTERINEITPEEQAGGIVSVLIPCSYFCSETPSSMEMGILFPVLPILIWDTREVINMSRTTQGFLGCVKAQDLHPVPSGQFPDSLSH